jgi:asparagine synthase (glutamine-hydrolysing)
MDPNVHEPAYGWQPSSRLRATITDGAATLDGPQRAVSGDGRHQLVLEGEILNAPELGDEIHVRGSEAEILLATFRAWGPRCFGRCVGAFVCAVVDTSTRRLTLARDHFGMKSLYYTHHGATLAFASTIGVLLPGLPTRQADPQALRDWLADGLTDHGCRTLFAGIRVVPPAHYAVVELARPDVPEPTPFWRPTLTGEIGLSFPAAAARCEELFLENVGRSRSGRVGATLSGGTDTSAIVLTLRHHRGAAADVHTFSYIGDDGAVSEERWIDIVNDAARAVPHKLRLHPDEWTADFKNLVELQGEPFGTIAVSAQHRLYRMAASAGVETLLGGGGADELLGGHLSARIASLFRRGGWIAAARLARRGPGFWRTLARAAALTLPERATRVAALAAQRRSRPWIAWDWLRSRGADPAGPWWLGEPGPTMLRSLLWRTVQRALPAVLRYEDRNASATGMRARFPFLTPALAEFVLSLPEAYVIADDGRGKAVFRAAMRGRVPEAVLDRRDKIGFSVPIQAWTLRLPAVAELLDAVQQIPAIDPRGVAPLLAAIRTGRPLPLRESFVVWRLVGLAAWARRFDVTFV